MIKVGLFTDVHANLPALKAVLAELDSQDCDLIYHLGDAINIGPYPSECVDEFLSRNDLVALMGNHERYVSHGIPEPQPDYLSDGEYEHILWTRSSLTEDQLQRLRILPYTVTYEYQNTVYGFLHSPLAADGSDFKMIRPDDLQDDTFSEMSADIVFIGHDHKPFDWDGATKVHNPGAAGTGGDGKAGYSILCNRRKCIQYCTAQGGIRYPAGAACDGRT